jgi:protein-tyrosine phosphatase
VLEGVRNFRDIGGHRTVDGRRVRTGEVFRAAHFAEATDRDLDVLRSLGIRVVIDFRGPGEIEAEGEDRLPAGVRLVPIPMYDPARGNDIRELLYSSPAEVVAEVYGSGRAAEAMVKGSVVFVTDAERVEQYGAMFRTIIEADGPAVFHCAAGKDRTGWGASLMLLVLGVPEETVIAHYLESNLHRRERSGRLLEFEEAGLDPEILQPFFDVREEYKRAALDAVERHWGGIDAYVHDGLRITEGELDRFRRRMLSDT